MSLLVAILALACAAGPAEDPRAPFVIASERGEQALRAGDLGTARGELHTALALASPKGRESVEYALAHANLAAYYRISEQPRKARHHLGLARLATRRALGNESLAMAAIEIEKSYQQHDAGDLEPAAETMDIALALTKAQVGAKDAGLARVLAAQGSAKHAALEYPTALASYRQALEIFETHPETSNGARRTLLERIAWLHDRAGLRDLADATRDLAAGIPTEPAGRALAPQRVAAPPLPPAHAPSPQHLQRMRRMSEFAHGWVRDRHFHEDHFSFDQYMLMTARRIDHDLPVERALRALERDLKASFLSFSKTRGRVRSSHTYRLPFETGVPRKVSHTLDGPHQHEFIFMHAADFEVPSGARVLAARGGTVVRVVMGFQGVANLPGERGRSDPRHGLAVNRVIVLHEDGTYATYLPLGPSLDVWEGESVEAGRLLGHAADTGKLTSIVHFDVRHNSMSNGAVAGKSVRASFAAVPGGGAPLAGRFYGGSPSDRASGRASGRQQMLSPAARSESR